MLLIQKVVVALFHGVCIIEAVLASSIAALSSWFAIIIIIKIPLERFIVGSHIFKLIRQLSQVVGGRAFETEFTKFILFCVFNHLLID